MMNSYVSARFKLALVLGSLMCQFISVNAIEGHNWNHRLLSSTQYYADWCAESIAHNCPEGYAVKSTEKQFVSSRIENPFDYPINGFKKYFRSRSSPKDTSLIINIFIEGMNNLKEYLGINQKYYEGFQDSECIEFNLDDEFREHRKVVADLLRVLHKIKDSLPLEQNYHTSTQFNNIIYTSQHRIDYLMDLTEHFIKKTEEGKQLMKLKLEEIHNHPGFNKHICILGYWYLTMDTSQWCTMISKVVNYHMY